MMQNPTASQLYRQFTPMIKGQAHRVARRYRRSPNETLSDANLVFAQTFAEYDPSKASFSTRLYGNLRKVEVKAGRANEKEGRHTSIYAPVSSEGECEVLMVDAMETQDPGPIRDLAIIEQVLRVLRGDAQTLALMILDKQLDPPVIKGNSNRQSIRLNAWTVYCRKTKELGWDLDRTRSAWDVLATAMSAYFLGIDPEV